MNIRQHHESIALLCLPAFCPLPLCEDSSPGGLADLPTKNHLRAMEQVLLLIQRQLYQQKDVLEIATWCSTYDQFCCPVSFGRSRVKRRDRTGASVKKKEKRKR